MKKKKKKLVPSAPAEHGAPRLPDVGVDCSACLSCGMAVLLVMTGFRVFHILMVLRKKDVLNTCAGIGQDVLSIPKGWHWRIQRGVAGVATPPPLNFQKRGVTSVAVVIIVRQLSKIMGTRRTKAPHFVHVLSITISFILGGSHIIREAEGGHIGFPRWPSCKIYKC